MNPFPLSTQARSYSHYYSNARSSAVLFRTLHVVIPFFWVYLVPIKISRKKSQHLKMDPNLTTGTKYLLEEKKHIAGGDSDLKRKLWGQRQGKEEEIGLFCLKDSPRYNSGSYGSNLEVQGWAKCKRWKLNHAETICQQLSRLSFFVFRFLHLYGRVTHVRQDKRTSKEFSLSLY